MLQNAHQLDVRVLHVLDVGHQLVDQFVVIERPAVLETPRQRMDLVDIERPAELVGERDARMLELVVGLAEDRRAVDVVLDGAGKGIDAKFPAAARFLHGELVVEPVVQTRNEALPDAGAAAALKGMGMDVPIVEAADDRDALRVGRPDGEADAVLDQVSAENAMGTAMFAHVEEIEVELGDGAKLGGVGRRLGLGRRLAFVFAGGRFGVRGRVRIGKEHGGASCRGQRSHFAAGGLAERQEVPGEGDFPTGPFI